jgi:phosphatidate cytidylyltransferase
MTRPSSPPVRFGDLGVRLASGLAIAAFAAFDLWLGGIWLALLAAVTLAAIMWELRRMVIGAGTLRSAGMATLLTASAAAVLLTHFVGVGAGVACLAAGAVSAFLLDRPHWKWLVAGLFYAGIPVSFAVILRRIDPNGLELLLWLIIVVIAADVGAYFVGRTVGGPKLWPKVSPGKTWSGAAGGLVAANAVGVLAAGPAGIGHVAAVFLSLGVGVASQCGDLLESAVKRRFGVKDSSRLIPGHGGVMDRLDGIIGGLWFLAFCAAVGIGPATS